MNTHPPPPPPRHQSHLRKNETRGRQMRDSVGDPATVRPFQRDRKGTLPGCLFSTCRRINKCGGAGGGARESDTDSEGIFHHPPRPLPCAPGGLLDSPRTTARMVLRRIQLFLRKRLQSQPPFLLPGCFPMVARLWRREAAEKRRRRAGGRAAAGGDEQCE